MALLLPTANTSFQIVLGGAVTTNQLPFVVNYLNYNSNGLNGIGQNHGTTNSTTPVTLLPAPANGSFRQGVTISVVNSDTVNATVIIRLNDNGTTRDMVKQVLAPNEGLYYEDGDGWRVM